MQKYLLLMSTAIVLSLFACSKESDLDSRADSSTMITSEKQESQKYIRFESQADFDRYISTLRSGGDALRAARSVRVSFPKGFKSIATLKAEQEKLRGANLESFDHLVDTEMTEEEFALFRAEELLMDSTLSLALDPSLRLEIGEDLYAVTEVGTFIADKDKEDDLNMAIDEMRDFALTSKAINPIVPISSPRWGDTKTHPKDLSLEYNNSEDINFEKPKTPLIDGTTRGYLDGLTPNEEFLFKNGVRFVNTYGSIEENATSDKDHLGSRGNNYSGNPNYDNGNQIIKITEPSYVQQTVFPRFEDGYNTKEFVYDESNGFNRFLGKLFGHNIGRENYFDKRHRAQLYVYELNFQFVTVTGIKARLQYRRRFLGINTIWTPARSERLAFGINHLHAEITEAVFDERAIAKNITAIGTVNNLSAQINGVIGEFVTQAYKNVDFIEDWSDKISMMVPRFAVWKKTIHEPGDFQKLLYDAPRNAIISMMHNTANRWIHTPLMKVASREQNTAPRAAMFPNGSGKRQIYCMGVEEYNQIKTKTITFNFAGGFALGQSGDDGKPRIGPYLPRKVDYKSFDIFVSIFHKGQWKGVRMYTR